MYTCNKMQAFIERIAKKHNFNLKERDPDKLGAVLKIENDPYIPLNIAVIGRDLVAVYHRNSDDAYDPEVVFFTGYPAWVPISIWQVPIYLGGRVGGGYREVARVRENDDGTKSISHIVKAGMRSVAQFVEGLWVPNLRSQGYLDSDQVVRYGC